jgi:hypothetical protein
MSVAKSHVEFAADNSKVSKSDVRLEVVVIPVSDVDRAKRFYAALGWRLDIDFASCSSLLQARCALSSSGAESQRPRPGRYKASISSYPTSKARAPI